MSTVTGTMPRHDRRPGWAIPALILGLAALALSTGWAGSLRSPTGDNGWLAALGLVAVLTVAGYLHLEFRRGDDAVSLDLFETAAAPAIFLFAGLPAVVIVAFGTALTEALLRVPPRKAVFNVAQTAAAAGVGSLVFTTLATGGDPSGGDVAALVLAMLAVSLVNHGSVMCALAVTEGRPLAEVAASFRPTVTAGWVVGVAATLSFGVLFAVAADWVPATIPLFVIPLLFLHWASEGYAASVSDLEHLQGLQRATHSLAAAADPTSALPSFVEEVRSTFRAESAELIIDREDGVATGFRTTDRVPAHRMPESVRSRCADLATPVEGAVRITADTADRPTSEAMRREGWQEVLAARIGNEPTFGTICVCNPERSAGSGDADLAVLVAMANEAAGAIERDRLVHAMLRSEGRFRALAQYSADLTVVVDEDGIILDDVPTSHPFGFPHGTKVGSRLTELIHPDDVGRARDTFTRRLGEAFATETVECRMLAADGSWRDVEVIATNLLDDPSVEGVALTCRDVTERTRAATLMRFQSDVLQAIARGLPLSEVLALIVDMLESQSPGSAGAILLTHDEGRLHPAAGARLPASVLERLALALVPDDEGTPADAPRTLEVDDGAWRAGGSGPPPTGGTLCAARLERGAEGHGGVVTLMLDRFRRAEPHEWHLLDLASRLVQLADERIRAQERLVRQATEDHLTGLPNRVVFLDRTAVALSRLERTGRGVAVVFVDLDRFKVVNDSLGHESGDRMLRILADRLQKAMRTNDTVARFGGDEFTILCDDVDDEREVTMIAERIREIIAAPVTLRGHDLTVTASLGIAHTNDPSADPAPLIDNADMAMYRAKVRGGNHIELFDPVLRTRAMRDLVTQSALRTSIDRGDLRVHYQPVISLESGGIVGVEALVRWEHPQLGLVAPDSFVPLAEQTGLIIPLGRFVLEEACRQTREWQEWSTRDLTTSVNLSARQFADPTLVDTVAEILATSGVDPGSINLEITETVLMDNADTTQTTLQELVDLGVHLTIDDFGTGYSSLNYLKRFPVGSLKIDRSFVFGLVDDADDSAIVAAVVGLAHSLGMVAVAEGVETEAQRQRLSELGCDVAQGYLFSRPVAADAIRLDRHFA